jgi:hypothetical protein
LAAEQDDGRIEVLKLMMAVRIIAASMAWLSICPPRLDGAL